MDFRNFVFSIGIFPKTLKHFPNTFSIEDGVLQLGSRFASREVVG